MRHRSARRVPPRRARCSARLASFASCLLAPWLALAPLASSASEIAVNIATTIHLQGSFADGIDAQLTVDPAKGAARLLTDRLGSFSGGRLFFRLDSQHGAAILDPGVAELPAEPRDLLRVTASATASGGLLADTLVQNLSARWFCDAAFKRCNDLLQRSPLRTDTPTMRAPGAASDLLGPIRLQATATHTVLADGVVLKTGTLFSSATLQAHTTFTAKTPTAYVADALQATAGSGGGLASTRYAAAASDVNALRNATWTDLGVDAALQARRTPELDAAQRLLAVARDSALLLETGATPGGSFASGFQSARQVWDVAAALQPALGRSASGLSGDDLFSSDRAAEVGVLRLVLQGGGDSAFTAGLADVLAHPVVNGPAAALRFDGALLGLDAGTTLSVYMVGNPFTGEAVLDLPNASHHALWRTNFDRLTLIDGPAAGLLVGGTLEAAGSQLTADGGEVYLGEGFGGLLTLSGGTGRIALNNAYGDQLMVVASWGEVSAPVPEPGAALLLAGGLAVVALVRRRRR